MGTRQISHMELFGGYSGKRKIIIDASEIFGDYSVMALDVYWIKYEKLKGTENKVDAQIVMRKASYHRGHAEGIYQALVVIGYSSAGMEELTKRI